MLLHRFILNAPKNKQIDHINGNGLDNRKSNLRLCTPQENARNRTKQKNNKSGLKGVSFDKTRNKWVARIKIQNRYKFLGRFESKELAYSKYTEVGQIHHKQFFKG